jgi:hypothetical protein
MSSGRGKYRLDFGPFVCVCSRWVADLLFDPALLAGEGRLQPDVILSAAWLPHIQGVPSLMELLLGWNVIGDKSACFAVAIAVLAVVIAAGYLLHDGWGSAEGIPST